MMAMVVMISKRQIRKELIKQFLWGHCLKNTRVVGINKMMTMRSRLVAG